MKAVNGVFLTFLSVALCVLLYRMVQFNDNVLSREHSKSMYRRCFPDFL